jgi:hypothetical protein
VKGSPPNLLAAPPRWPGCRAAGCRRLSAPSPPCAEVGGCRSTRPAGAGKPASSARQGEPSDSTTVKMAAAPTAPAGGGGRLIPWSQEEDDLLRQVCVRRTRTCALFRTCLPPTLRKHKTATRTHAPYAFPARQRCPAPGCCRAPPRAALHARAARVAFARARPGPGRLVPSSSARHTGVLSPTLTTPAHARAPARAQLVATHGCKKWALLASKMPNKGSKQCRRRWQNYLNNADAKQGGWSGEEARARAPACARPSRACARPAAPTRRHARARASHARPGHAAAR